MRFVRSGALVALLATTVSVPALAGNPTAADKAAAKAALTTLSQLNVFVKDTLTNSGGEIEGKVWVGNNLNGNSGFNIGFGASNGQSTVASAFATVTVGGTQNAGVQIKNSVGGAYGAYVGGSSNGEINVQDDGTASNRVNVTVGGTSSAGIKVKAYQDTVVGGSYTSQNGLDLSTNGSVWVGGDLSKFQGGQNNSVKVHGTLTYGLVTQGGSLQVGGAINGGQAASGTTVTALGNITSFEAAGTVKTNGTYSNGKITGSGGKLYAKGGVSNVNNETGNANAIQTGANVFSGAVTAPADPGVPAVASVSTQTQTMYDNFTALQNALSHLATAGHTGTVSVTNSGQAYTFSSTATSGYTVFNVDQTIFSKNEFSYSFANATTPVIINVKSTDACSATASCSYTMNSNFVNNAGLYNQNVIWNFVDASSVVLNRQFQGSVIAALADLQSNVIEGSVVAKNFKQTNEVHLGTYNGNNGFILTGVIPEPGQWTMLIAGFGVVGGVVRLRRRSILTIA